MGPERAQLRHAHPAQPRLSPHEGGRCGGDSPERRHHTPPAGRRVCEKRAADRSACAAGVPGLAYGLHRCALHPFPGGGGRAQDPHRHGPGRVWWPHHGQAAGQPARSGHAGGRHRHGADQPVSWRPHQRPAQQGRRADVPQGQGDGARRRARLLDGRRPHGRSARRHERRVRKRAAHLCRHARRHAGAVCGGCASCPGYPVGGRLRPHARPHAV